MGIKYPKTARWLIVQSKSVQSSHIPFVSCTGGYSLPMSHLGRSRVPRVFGHVWLFVTIWTVAHEAPLSMGFSRQKYWSGLPCLLQGIFPTQGLSPRVLCLPHWQVGSLPLAPSGKPWEAHAYTYIPSFWISFWFRSPSYIKQSSLAIQ